MDFKRKEEKRATEKTGVEYSPGPIPGIPLLLPRWEPKGDFLGGYFPMGHPQQKGPKEIGPPVKRNGGKGVSAEPILIKDSINRESQIANMNRRPANPEKNNNGGRRSSLIPRVFPLALWGRIYNELSSRKNNLDGEPREHRGLSRRGGRYYE